MIAFRIPRKPNLSPALRIPVADVETAIGAGVCRLLPRLYPEIKALTEGANAPPLSPMTRWKSPFASGDDIK